MYDLIMDLVSVFTPDVCVNVGVIFICFWICVSYFMQFENEVTQKRIDTLLLWCVITVVLVLMAIGFSNEVFFPIDVPLPS